MNGQEKSDSAIVAGKPTNGAGRLAEEPAEPAGECGPAKHAPGAEPGKRVTGAGPHTTARGSASPSPPEAGAVCGNSARTDLCGGRSVMSVPTAIN
jgi:hypothetical protein